MLRKRGQVRSGPLREYIRYHFGLVVPTHNPPTIRAKVQYHTWQEGKSVLFDDSWGHEVYNQSDDIRVVLIVEVLRPMPARFDTVNRLFTRVIWRVYGKKLLEQLR
jgi:aspartyl/asparaginyl beta-hydroxylase (cupin superfamily)